MPNHLPKLSSAYIRVSTSMNPLDEGEHTDRRFSVVNYKIDLTWDEEAAVWVATSDDIPGLVLESGSFDALLERLRYAVPELLSLNGISPGSATVTFQSTRQERLAI